MDPRSRELLADLLLGWEDGYLRGHDVPAEELARDHPDLVAPLARRIDVLRTTFWIDHPPDDGSSAEEAPSAGSVGRTLAGRFRLDELVAVGGFAEVWKAHDAELDRVVAVKIPRPSRFARNESFLAEARRVARLRHPSILPVHDVGTDGTDFFIVSAYMDGGSLADRLADGPLEFERAVRWIGQVADALDFAHRSGVVHRDVKPANILITHHEDATLADFGIAQSATKGGDFSPTLGTLRYMAPEQLCGGEVGHAADIFSLGIVLHEALTGRTPHATDTPAGIRREIAAGRNLIVSPDCPPRVAGICRRAIARDPERRHRSAAAFAADLRTAAGLAGAVPVPDFDRRRWTLAGIAAFTLLGVAGFAAWPRASRTNHGAVAGIIPGDRATPLLRPDAETAIAALLFERIEDALPYVVDARNIRRYREWQEPPLTYLGPVIDGREASVTFRFDCVAPIAGARLLASSFCKDFLRIPGGQGRGSSAIEVSEDGSEWHPIRDNIRAGVWGEDWYVDERLPAAVIGGQAIWVRIRLLTQDSPNLGYTTAQFGRDPVDGANSPTRFGIVVEFDPAE